MTSLRLVDEDGDILLEMSEDEWGFVTGDLMCAEDNDVELEDESLAFMEAVRMVRAKS